VESKKEEYLKAHVKDKKKIVLSIIRQIQSLNPPGRFLQHDPNFHGNANNTLFGMAAWVIVDEDKAAAKVGHCLRERKKEKDTVGKKDDDEMNESPQESTPIFDKAESCVEKSRQSGYASNLENIARGLESRFNSSNARANEQNEDEKFQITPTTQIESNKYSSTVKLREWIKNAIDSIDISSLAEKSHFSCSYGSHVSSWPKTIRGYLAILSNSYIVSALTIAHSLAEQMCDARGSYLPTTEYDWAHQVIVHVTTPSRQNETDELFDFEPLDMTSSEDVGWLKHEELGVLLSSISQDMLLHENNDGCGGECNEDLNSKENESHSRIFLKATNAQLLPPPTSDKRPGNPIKDERQLIYMLGTVFYELFSGGEPLPTIHRSSSSANTTTNIFGELSISVNDCKSHHEFVESRGQTDSCEPVRKKKGTKQNKTDFLLDLDEGARVIVSVEPLKLKGIPPSLCDLIGNMLDCKSGNFSEDETYHQMIDVRNDLRLMLDKPSKFLHNPGIEKISVSGLELNNSVYGQEGELSALKECYYCSLSQNKEYAIITGPSGTGKTVLAHRFADCVVANGGVFLSGKYDQLQQAAPFSAIASAFNEYCNMLVVHAESLNATAVASGLRELFGHDAFHLVSVIPNLSMIVGDSGGLHGKEDCVDAQERLQYLLCRFVEIISISTKKPLILFLDDLQWADRASIAVIKRLLLTLSASRFLFVGSYREGEMNEHHHVWNMMSTISDLGVNARVIQMSHLNRDVVNDMISDMLRLSPRLTRPLADIAYHKTKGNPLFLKRLMISLSKDGLLRFSLSRRRWVWDEEKIQSRKIPDDVATFLTSAIFKLSPDVQNALCTLSCFGAATDEAVIDVLETDLGVNLKNALEYAVSEGFLEKVDRNYQFSHDRVQEAAYNMLGFEHRAEMHLEYGIALCLRTAKNDNDDSLLFTAVNQINRGNLSAISDSNHRSMIASLNLQAGKKAMSMSDFGLALSFFEHGSSFLCQNHWNDDYDLSLELFDCSAKCAYAIGDHMRLGEISKQVLSGARSFGDKLNVLYHSVSSLFDASLMNEAIDKGFWVLSMLGINLPRPSSTDEILSLIEETRSTLRGLSDGALLNYKLMTDSTKIMAMKFLSRIEMSLVMTSCDFTPIVMLQMLKLSLEHGITPISAVGFVYFGSVLVSIGHIEEGYRYVKLAKKLVSQFDAKEVAGEVIAISTQAIGYIEPMQSAIEFHVLGHKSALEAGDIGFASMNCSLYISNLLWSGLNLNQVQKEFDKAHSFMEQHSTWSLLVITGPLLQSIGKLVSVEELPLFQERKYQSLGPMAEFHREKNPFATKIFYLHNMYQTFIFRNFDRLEDTADEFIDFKIQTWTALNTHNVQCFICGLVSFLLYRRTNKNVWFERGSEFKLMMKRWSECSEWNFLHKFHLLEAEEHFCNKRLEEAKLSYDAAVSFSKKHKFVNDEALACELAGYFFLEIGERSRSLEYFIDAHEKYHEWGATAKATSVYKYVESIFRLR